MEYGKKCEKEWLQFDKSIFDLMNPNGKNLNMEGTC